MIETLYAIYRQYPRVQTDTRQLQSGELFFALKGPHFNGNLFAEKALEMGAAAVVVDEPQRVTDKRIFLVPDVLETLQELALYHRKQFTIPFLAITGSNGKTTTKELVSAVLASTFKTATTKGNLNNHIGIPLTILAIPPDSEMAVVEMGANHQQEIASYCRYTLPTHGLITNCGKAHLEGFGGVEGVRKGKGELFDYLRLHSGTAFVMWDYAYFHPMSSGIPTIIRYGTREAEITGTVTGSEPYLEVSVTTDEASFPVSTNLVGDYNLPNVLAAVAVGHHFGVPFEKIRQSIEQYQPTNSRSQLISGKKNTFVLDAYNANPSSVRLAIENFARQPHNAKYVCLGAMMELGTDSLAEHQAIVELLKQFSWTDVLLVGGDFEKTTHPYRFFATATAAMDWLRKQSIEKGMFLIKGSRSMRMEILLQAFE